MKTLNIVLGILGAVCLLGCTTPENHSDTAPLKFKCLEGIKVENFVYAVKGNDTLTVDIYTDPAAPAGVNRPLLIYLYGGGFESGTRFDGSSDILDFVPYFVREYGYIGAAIDYRVEFANARRQGRVPENTAATDFDDPAYMSCQAVVDELISAKEMAVEDFMDATSFLLGLADKYGFDTGKVIAAGSSAGALTILGAEYHLCNGHEMASSHLPADFRYAALIPMAGGIWTSIDEQLHFDTAPCPIMLFHGDADELVPYGRMDLKQFGVSWHGSREIADLLREMRVPYCLYTVEGASHIINGLTMATNKSEIDGFVKRMLDLEMKVQVEVVERSLTQPHDAKWAMEEYVIPLVKKHPEYGIQMGAELTDTPTKPND